MWVAMWNCHSWPLDVSSNVKLPFWTTRCQYWGVDLLADLPIAILDHKMSVPGGRSAGRSRGRSANCHSWPLDVSSNVKLPFLTTRCQYWGVDLLADIGVDLPNLNSFTFRALLHRRPFRITYERPNQYGSNNIHKKEYVYFVITEKEMFHFFHILKDMLFCNLENSFFIFHLPNNLL